MLDFLRVARPFWELAAMVGKSLDEFHDDRSRRDVTGMVVFIGTPLLISGRRIMIIHPVNLEMLFWELENFSRLCIDVFLQWHLAVVSPISLLINRRKFRSQTSDNMERWKAEQGRGREKRKIRRKKSRRERVRRQKMQMREEVGESRNTMFFQWFVAPEGRKVGSLKRRVRSQLARWEMKNCTPLWREAHFQVKMYKTHHSRTTFWKLRCRKSARRCGAKHISKSKCTKHTRFGPLLEVEMSKKCTPLWREAHFQVKMYKTHHSRTTFGSWDVEKVHAVVARSTFRSQNVQNTPCSDHFWRFRCRKSARRCGAKGISKSKCSKHPGFGPLLEVQMSLRFTRVHYITLHYAPLHYTTLHYTTLHYTPQHNTTTTTTQLHSTTLHYTKLHYTTLHYLPLHFTTLHYTTLHSTTLQLHNHTPLHSTTLHYTKLHYTTLHYITLRSTTLHYITLQYTTLHSTTLHYTIFHYTSLHYTTLHSTALQLQLQLHNYTPLHSTTLNYTTLHCTTLHYTTFRHTPLHHTTLHYTTLHWMTLHHR